MRKIQTEAERERKKKRNNIILVVIMVALIGFSSLGYAIMSRNDNQQTNNSATFGGLAFVKSNGYWTTTINDKVFYFSSLPLELQNVSIKGNYSFENYYGKAVYIVNINSAVNGLMYALQDIALRTQEACISGEECLNAEFPVKTCDENVIIFSSVNSNETRVIQNNSCVYIYGNFFEGTDKLVYRMLNVA